MKSERCNQKNNVVFYIFWTMIILCLTFLRGSYYERNIYYKLDDIVVELGDPLPNEIVKNKTIFADENFSIETNAKVDSEGYTKEIGNYSYYLVYNDPNYQYSKPTNIKASIKVIDTIKPIISINETNEFVYGSEISAYDIATCYDLSKCTLSLGNEIDTYTSGQVQVVINAYDEGGNKETITAEILIKEKPQQVFNTFYEYPDEFNYNYGINHSLTEEDKNILRNQIISFAKQFVGNPYVYGGTSLTNGTDCSGFTMSVYNNFGYSLPRSATSQGYVGKQVSEYELLQGDLIVYYYPSGGGHVGIYLGDGMMIHAGTTQTGIVIAPIFEGYKTYRRIIY